MEQGKLSGETIMSVKNKSEGLSLNIRCLSLFPVMTGDALIADICTKRNKSEHKLHSDLFWWERVDSNHRSHRQQIYSLPPLATREHSHKYEIIKNGAGGRTRTPDLLITNQLLYQLSYTSR